MKDLRYYLNKAKKEKWALGQFNFSNLEQLRGILGAAQRLKSPVILGTSEGELGYLGIKEAVALLEISKTKYNVAAFLNLDHGKDLKLIKECLNYGYSGVHFDGSKLAFKKNIVQAKKVVQMARGAVVEGELNKIGGKAMTDPLEAEEFQKKSGVDTLAVNIGSRHGYHKVKLDLKRLGKMNGLLVLHGGSGISNSQIKKAIKLGIVKINVNTELRMAWKKSMMLKEVKPYKVMGRAQKEVQKKVEEKIKLFSSYNKV